MKLLNKILLIFALSIFVNNTINSQELWKLVHTNFPEKSFIKKNKIKRIESVSKSSLDTKKINEIWTFNKDGEILTYKQYFGIATPTFSEYEYYKNGKLKRIFEVGGSFAADQNDSIITEYRYVNNDKCEVFVISNGDESHVLDIFFKNGKLMYKILNKDTTFYNADEKEKCFYSLANKTKTFWRYNKKNQLILKQVVAYNDTSVVKAKTVYTYQDNNLIKSEKFSKSLWDKDKWLESTEVNKYYYNNKRFMIKKEFYYSGELTTTITYKYFKD